MTRSTDRFRSAINSSTMRSCSGVTMACSASGCCRRSTCQPCSSIWSPMAKIFAFLAVDRYAKTLISGSLSTSSSGMERIPSCSASVVSITLRASSR